VSTTFLTQVRKENFVKKPSIDPVQFCALGATLVNVITVISPIFKDIFMSTDLAPPVEEECKSLLVKMANTIRVLAMDAVQKANSGHPGMPLGCAELGAFLYGHLLRHNPHSPNWINRDRVILSAGHGSMWLYSCLHLSGFDLSLEEIKNFRQLHSKTPGHPESHETPGVETTTGPLGQGLANGVGTALGLQLLASRFNTPDFPLITSKVYVVAGDGCIMEGITSEASSFAGHLGLNNLVVFYDANDISLDGPLNESCSEDTKMRYLSYGWDVVEVNGHDINQLDEVCQKALCNQKKPLLIITKTTIGKGAPSKAGSHKCHGAPLGDEEIKQAKKDLGVPEEEFYVPKAVRSYFQEKLERDAQLENDWINMFENWSRSFPEKREEFDAMLHNEIPEALEGSLSDLTLSQSISGRKASHMILSHLADLLPQLYCGSADLSCSDLTSVQQYPVVSKEQKNGRNIKFGVREFAMGAMATGMRQTRMILPVIGTFLTFSDYMRNAIRLASLMKEQIIYQFTHDSIFLGEDGPTHQPVEHLAALRAIPNLRVIRPSGTHEVKMAWLAALSYQGPTALVLSRQNIWDLPETERSFEDGLGRGAYIIHKEKRPADFTLIGTGSELPLTMDVAIALEQVGKSVRVISMPCWELFEQQPESYKRELFGADSGKKVSIEAGSEQGWHKYIGADGIAISVEGFGTSAPPCIIAREYGFTVDAILERVLT